MGIIDSGLGGISILKTIIDKYANANVVCIADQLNAPYGNRSEEEIIDLTLKNINWLKDQNVSEVLIACNTSTAVALQASREAFFDLKIEGIIDVTARQLAEPKPARILVVATKATVKSEVYLRIFEKYCPSSTVIQKPLSELVDMLEGETAESLIKDYLFENLSGYQDRVDAVVLGCTHYYLVEEEIKKIVGCPVYDSNTAIAKEDYGFEDEHGEIKIYTTKDAIELKRQIKLLYDLDYPVELAKL